MKTEDGCEKGGEKGNWGYGNQEKSPIKRSCGGGQRQCTRKIRMNRIRSVRKTTSIRMRD